MPRLILLCLLATACRDPAPVQTMTAEPGKVALAVAPAPEAKAPPQAEEIVVAETPKDDCNVQVYVVDPDPAGLNVRAEPSAKSGIVGNIAKDPDGTVLEVTSARNGWLKVRRAQPMNTDAYDVDGWVSGQMTQTSLRCPDENPAQDCTVALHAGPSRDDAEVTRLSAEAAVKVVGCQGDWVQAQTVGASRARGWIGRSAQCANPVTTCP